MMKTRLINSLASRYIWRFSTILIKNKSVQNTKSKVQGSIRYTPEGTHTVRKRLTGAVRVTRIEVHAASPVAMALCTTPVECGGGVTR